MNETCELLLKSFYEDEWVEDSPTTKRRKDGLELWVSGVFSFTGWRNHIHIPFFLRPWMKYHYKKGQNLLDTKRYLYEGEGGQ